MKVQSISHKVPVTSGSLKYVLSTFLATFVKMHGMIGISVVFGDF